MKAQRVDEFHKYGSHFYGKLVVVDYSQDVLDSHCVVNFGRGLPELSDAKKLVADRG